MSAPNLRLNALTVGFRLLFAAANPWSGLTRRAADKGPWQPEDPFGWPRWWPFARGWGRSVSLDEIAMIRSVLPSGLPRQAEPSELRHRTLR
jgi:hypothetical protein